MQFQPAPLFLVQYPHHSQPLHSLLSLNDAHEDSQFWVHPQLELHPQWVLPFLRLYPLISPTPALATTSNCGLLSGISDGATGLTPFTICGQKSEGDKIPIRITRYQLKPRYSSKEYKRKQINFLKSYNLLNKIKDVFVHHSARLFQSRFGTSRSTNLEF